MAENSFEKFERYIQLLLEGTFTQLFAGRLHPREVALALAHAMEDHTDVDAFGRKVAPDVYIVRLNPQDHAAILAANPNLEQSLADELIEMARTVSYTLVIRPTVRLISSDGTRAQAVDVTARHSEEARSATGAMNTPTSPPEDSDRPPAYLVLKEERHIPLDKPLINIGRHRDNHIIIDDPRVSRHHAQIRLRFGQYVLFDTGSTGGTTVNGQRVKEAALYSGDVISLAGYSLLFIDNKPSSDTSAHTTP